MIKIYITGVSGTGKTTLADELTRLGYLAISIDEVDGLCSWVHQKTGEKHGGKDAEMTKEFVDAHDWVCDVDYLKRLLNTQDTIGFVLGMATNETEVLPLFDKIILLQCSPAVFTKRIEDRTDNSFGKDKNVMQQIIKRAETYAEEMLAMGAIPVDTNRPVNEVANQVLQIAHGLVR